MKNFETPLEYKICRLNLNQHPILIEGVHTRYNYFGLLYQILCEVEDKQRWEIKIDHILGAYCQAFRVPLIVLEEMKRLNKKERNKHIQDSVRRILNQKKIFNQWGIYHRDYFNLLVSDILFLNFLLEPSSKIQNQLEDILSYYKIDLSIIETINEFFFSLFTNNFDDAKKVLSLEQFKDLEYYYKVFQDNHIFEQLDGKNIALIATMSAGKSTLLNTIIDQKIFPSENKACTAKIFEYTHNPYHQRLLARTAGGNPEVRWTVEFSDVKIWNENPNIVTIHIEGKAGTLSVLDKKITFIDTPGTNNSRDGRHKKITEQFLNKDSHDLTIYILNATNLAIDDDVQLLKKVIEQAGYQKIVFVLNKMDQLDVEGGDSIDDIICEANEYLKGHGIDEPVIFPISSYAANLFKRVLNGDSFSRKENRDFRNLYELFKENIYDMNQYIPDHLQAPEQLYTLEPKIIEFDNEQYSTDEIFKVLMRTGVPNVEYQLIK